MQFVGKSWLSAVIVLLPLPLPLPLPPAAGVVVLVVLTGVGGWETGAGAVVMGLIGGAKFEGVDTMLEDMPVLDVGLTLLGEVKG